MLAIFVTFLSGYFLYLPNILIRIFTQVVVCLSPVYTNPTTVITCLKPAGVHANSHHHHHHYNHHHHATHHYHKALSASPTLSRVFQRQAAVHVTPKRSQYSTPAPVNASTPSSPPLETRRLGQHHHHHHHHSHGHHSHVTHTPSNTIEPCINGTVPGHNAIEYSTLTSPVMSESVLSSCRSTPGSLAV